MEGGDRGQMQALHAIFLEGLKEKKEPQAE
jgi:hypothetical protein